MERIRVDLGCLDMGTRGPVVEPAAEPGRDNPDYNRENDPAWVAQEMQRVRRILDGKARASDWAGDLAPSAVTPASPEILAQACELSGRGYKPAAIAEALDLSPREVRQAVKPAAAKPAKPRRAAPAGPELDSLQARVRQLAGRGYDERQIAQVCEISVARVRRLR